MDREHLTDEGAFAALNRSADQLPRALEAEFLYRVLGQLAREVEAEALDDLDAEARCCSIAATVYGEMAGRQ